MIAEAPLFEHPHRLARAGYSVMLAHYSPGLTMPRHAHDDAAIGIVLSGGMEEDVSQARVDAGAGTLLVKPRGTAHANRSGATGASILSITLPEGGELVPGAGSTAVARWGAHRSFAAYRCGVDVLRVLRAGRLNELTGAVLDLLATLVNAAERTPAGPAPRWLGEVRAYLDEPAGRERSVEEIAGSLDLHPTYLARRFRAAFRCTITQYRRRARLLAGARLLAAPGCSLSRAAHEAGFADHSHFCREARRELGLTPSSLRTLIVPT